MRFSSAHIVALQKGTQAATGLITALFVSHFLSPYEQGYYYTLGSLLSGYILLDLGLSNLITQKSAQLSKGLHIDPRNWTKSQRKEGRPFLGLIKWTQSAYLKLALLSWGLWPVGYFFLGVLNREISFEWQLPWALIVLCISLSQPAQGFLSLLEGTGAIKETYTLRIAYYLLGAVSGWILIIQHQALFALSMPLLWTCLVVFTSYMFRYRNGLKKTATTPKKVEWKKTLWPEQKDVAAIWISNYAILNLPVLLSFTLGAVQDAGKLGLSIVIANVLGAIALSPVTAKLPSVIHLIEKAETDKAGEIFRSSIIRAAGLYLLGSFIGLGLLILTDQTAFYSRVLSPNLFALLLFGFAGFHGITAFTTYARVRWKTVFAPISLLSIALMMFGFLFLAPIGALGIVMILTGTTWAAFIGCIVFNRINVRRYQTGST